MPQTVARLVTVLVVWCAVLAFAQSSEGPPPAAAPKAQFFAGAVTALDEQHITVSRTLVGRPPENRTFLINPDTKWNKSALKIKSRVTVRYQRMPEGDLALEIQIRHSRT